MRSMNKSLGETFKDFLGERRTSPMYQSFLISRSLWNRNFIYIMFFEDSSSIEYKYGILKSEYLTMIYGIDCYSITHLILGPIISILFFFFILNEIELWFRDKANKNQIEQINIDQELMETKNKRQKIENEGENTELEAMKIANGKLEENIKIMENELKKSQINKTIKKELTEEDQRDKDYQELQKDYAFSSYLKDLEYLTGKSSTNMSYNDTYDKYKGVFISYDLLEKGDQRFNITPKGKYFMKKKKKESL